MKNKENLDALIEKERVRTDQNAFQNEYIYQKFVSRKVLYDYINASIFNELSTDDRVLDVGCGIGVLVEHLSSRVKEVWGIDTSKERIRHARNRMPELKNRLLVEGGERTSFKNNTFDLVVFCGVLMYVKDKQKAVNEMARVTRRGGTVLATLEPDYGDVISYPEDPILEPVFESLKDMGVDICTGRKLRSFFSNAGLQSEIGIFTGHLEDLSKSTTEQVDLFLKGFWFIEKALVRKGWTQKHIKEYKKRYIQLIEDRTIFQFLPAFYAIGKKVLKGKRFK